jgi:hypothetical protein
VGPNQAVALGPNQTGVLNTAHSFEDLLTDLGTLCRNTIRIGNSPHTFARLTTPTELQTAAYQLISVKPGK